MRFEKLYAGLFGWKILLELKDSNIVVVKRKNDRVLLSDNIIYSRLVDGSIYTRSYWDYFSALPAIYNEPKVLLIGLGGGTIPYQISHIFKGSVKVDAVEINPDMVTASRAFLPDRLNANVILEDGVAYVARCKEKYDIVILDSFKKASLPEPFFSKEFVDNVYRILGDDGIFAVNYIFSATRMVRQYPYRRSMRRTGLKVYTINMQPMLSNQIFIASKRLDKRQIVERLERNCPRSDESNIVLNGFRKMG